MGGLPTAEERRAALPRRGHLNGGDLQAIARFCGLPGDGIIRCRRPKSLASETHRILQGLGVENTRSPERVILEQWSSVVGEAFAGRCRPRRLGPDGTLWIEVSNPVVRQELNLLAPRLLLQVRQLPGCGGVKRLRARG